MNIVQHIEADNLSVDFVSYVKKVFKGQKIKMTIETELDETAYLMSNDANHKRILNSIKNIKKREKLVPLDNKQLKKISNLSGRANLDQIIFLAISQTPYQLAHE